MELITAVKIYIVVKGILSGPYDWERGCPTYSA
jgi:hypothetical protein